MTPTKYQGKDENDEGQFKKQNARLQQNTHWNRHSIFLNTLQTVEEKRLGQHAIQLHLKIWSKYFCVG
jgi:hypothetical protein